MNDGIRGLPPARKRAFSKNAVLLNGTALTTFVGWQVTIPCDVVRVAAIREGGTAQGVSISHGTVANAGVGEVVVPASAGLLTATGAWVSVPGTNAAQALVNTHFEPGDNLLFIFGSPTGSPTSTTIQIDFVEAP